MNLSSKSWVHWLTAIFLGILLVMQLASQPKTHYPRTQMFSHMLATMASDVSAGNGLEKQGYHLRDASAVLLKQTMGLPFFLVQPVPGLWHPKPWDSAVRFNQMFCFLAVVIAVLTYNCIWCWWISSLTSMISAANAQYPPHIQSAGYRPASGCLGVGVLLLGPTQ
jgi:hypothetical protein